MARHAAFLLVNFASILFPASMAFSLWTLPPSLPVMNRRTMGRLLPLPTPTTTTNLLCVADAASELESFTSPRRLMYGALWTGLLGYATYFTKSVNVDEQVAAKVLNTAVFTPFDGTLSPVFISLFFALGVLPSVYACLLLPASKRQRIWAFPFVASSFFLGFFGIGPYLGLRNKPSADVAAPWTRANADIGSGVLEFKGTPLFLLLSACYLVYYACYGEYAADRWQGFAELFDTQPLARISTIDFTILSLAMFDPLEEDMRRRRYSGPDAKLFCSLPVIGPLVYLLLRPPVTAGEDA